jgi:hypothetical protein
MILYHHLLASLILMAPPVLAQASSPSRVKNAAVAKFDRPLAAGK